MPPWPTQSSVSGLGGVPAYSGSIGAPLGTSASLYGALGGTQPSASAVTAPPFATRELPVTQAYERAAAALSAQVASGASFALNIDGEGGGAGAYESKFSNPLSMPTEVYLEPPGNYEVTIQTLQSLEASGGAVSGMRAPMASQANNLPSSALVGFEPGPGFVERRESQAYAARGGAGAAVEETVSALQGNSFQQYGQPREMGAPGAPGGSAPYGAASTAPPVIDGAMYGSSSPAAFDGAKYGTSYSSKSPAAFDATRSQKQELENFNFPTAGSFVATPYDGDGLPTYAGLDAPPQPSFDAPGSRKPYYDPRYDESGASRSAMGLAGSYGFDGADARRSAMSMAAGQSRGTGGLGSFDYSSSQAYGAASPYSGVPPAGKISHASIAAPSISSPGVGSFAIASTGSFVASPFAEGAPTLDMIPPPAPYAPPPMSLGGAGLPASGSFVAEPFAGGAPTPDVLGMSMRPRMPGGYPDYASVPPSSYMYGSAPPGPVGFGSNPFSYGQSPFVGFDAEVPGKPFGTANFGVESTSSFVMPEGGPASNGVKSTSEPQAQQPRPSKAAVEQEIVEDPNSKARMPRSRDRDGAPKTKRKGERRACC